MGLTGGVLEELKEDSEGGVMRGEDYQWRQY
jgi:hypothetical protein